MTSKAPFARFIIFYLSILFLLSAFYLPGYAQEITKPKKGILEIGFGLSTLGPTRQMVNLMKDYDLDGSHMTLFLDKKQYPRYFWFGTEFHLAYFRQIADKSRLGISFSSLERGTVKGYSNANGGFLDVRFSQASIALQYRHILKKNLDFEAGPAIVFNDATIDTNEDDSQDYTKASPGLKFGFNLVILERPKSNLKSDIKFIYSGSHTMGPFSANSSSAPTTIPAKSYKFNFISFGLAWGFFL
ncbi:MAG: hypothetical protein K0B15_13865 [Lentimicrobium sp.]|nr:hypothetical protein [Lentimicrobium sp.]